ncbi:GWT1-domain-containing protein [Gaertneriomyces semiglobifer]|nr:GWT1-domain-containing protein [Gaertneriomyces semiglobifer]
MDEVLRRAKEQHVAGHSGTSVYECQLILLMTVLSYALWKAITAKSLLPSSSAGVFTVEFLILVVPFVISVTSEALWNVIVALLSGIAFVLLLPGKAARHSAATKPTRQSANANRVLWFPFLTPVRACLQLVTIVCILAVDFRAFPRRFAKTETYGTSLMDLGVGLFIFCGGLVAGPRLKEVTLGKSLRQAIPVLILGVTRVVLTKGVNYQEHVTEYGVHWNFFITLGLVPLFVALLQYVAPNARPRTTAGVIMGAYTVMLHYGGIEQYIINAPRDNWFSMNREGAFSFLGYAAIFLFAADVGSRLRELVLLQPLPQSLSVIIKELGLLLLAVTSAFGIAVSTLHMEPSRRMANLPYCLWVCAAGLFHVLGCASVDKIAAWFRRPDAPSAPQIYESVNRNQLSAFLLANVLTGVINLSVNTLAVSDAAAVVILLVYTALVIGFTEALHSRNITLKL